MRENRPHGSEGGGAEFIQPSLPLSFGCGRSPRQDSCSLDIHVRDIDQTLSPCPTTASHNSLRFGRVLWLCDGHECPSYLGQFFCRMGIPARRAFPQKKSRTGMSKVQTIHFKFRRGSFLAAPVKEKSSNAASRKGTSGQAIKFSPLENQ